MCHARFVTTDETAVQPDDALEPGQARRRTVPFARAAMGERLGGYIYGTIVVLAVLVAGARAYPHEAGHIAVVALATSAALWIAHVYAHGLAHSVEHDEHLTLAELLRIARREGSLVEAALPPVAALLLGALGVVSTQAAVWIAFVLGLLVLAAQGMTFARIERLGLLATVVVVTANMALGVLLIGLKLFVTH
jgi:hypothetical protein